MLGAPVAAKASQSFELPRPLVSVTVAGLPGFTVVALTVRTGGVLIVNGRLPLVPPPGAGENTVTEALPGVAMSEAGICARSCVAEKVVVRLTPFQRIEDPLANPLPDTVNVNPGPPPIADAGDSAVNDGTGLSTTGTVIAGLVAILVEPPFG